MFLGTFIINFSINQNVFVMQKHLQSLLQDVFSSRQTGEFVCSRFMKTLLLVGAMMIVPWVTQAQGVQGCTFSTGVDTTAWITLSSSATHITAIEGEDDIEGVCINIGFDFYFGGFTYTQFSCNSNGRFRLGSTPCSWYWTQPFMTLTDPDNNDLPFITAFGMDNTLEGTSSYVKYELVGTTPNRILVVEYLTPSEYDPMATW